MGAGTSAAHGGLLVALMFLAVWRRRRPAATSGLHCSVRVARTSRPALWLLLCGAIALAAAPSVANGARKEKAAVVYLAPQPDLRHMTDAQSALPKVIAEEVLHSSEVFSPDDVAVSIVGALSTWTCPEDRDAPRLGAARDRAIDRLIELDPQGARNELDSAIDFLACVMSPVANRPLSDLYYYRGAASLQLGDVGSAEEDFGQAAAMRPDYQGDTNLPPDVNQAFLSAKARVEGEDPALLFVYAPPGLEARLDGRDLDVAEGGMDVAPGIHIVQLTRNGRTDSLVFELRPGTISVVLLRDDIDQALVEAPRNESARAFAQQVLGLLAADVGVDLVAVIDLFDGAPGYFYRAGTDSFSFDGSQEPQRLSGGSLSSGSADDDRQGDRDRALVVTPSSGSSVTQERLTPRSTSGSGGGASMRVRSTGRQKQVQSRSRVSARVADDSRIRLRLSGGYAYVHPWSYVHIPLDVGVRIWQGLHVDAGFELSTPGPSRDEMIWLPAGSVGLSYRIPLGPVEPRFGAVGRIAVDRQAETSATPLGGWAIRAGLDLTLPGTGPLLLGFDVQGGMLGKPFYLSASFGAGIRL